MPAIGLSFYDELKAAGVTDWRFTWGADGAIEFHEDVPQAVRDAVMKVYEAHDPSSELPPAPKKLTDGDLAAALVKANVLTQAQVDAAVTEASLDKV